MGGARSILGALVGTLVVRGVGSWLSGISVDYWLIFPWRPVHRDRHGWGFLRSSRSGQANSSEGWRPCCETVDLGIRFGGLVALHDFNLSVEQGEIHGVIGPNGSGKSTLFNLIIGRHKPSSGLIRFEGHSLAHSTPDQRARMGMTIKFQTSRLFPDLSVIENVMLGCIASRSVFGELRRRSWSSSDTALAEEMLETVGLRSKADQLAGTLAHGEMAWLEIGMALATRPKLLLLDEPTSGMGPEETARTVELIKRIRSGLTAIGHRA